MRRLAFALLLAAAPVFGSNRTTSFRIGARVVDSTTVSSEVATGSIRLKTATRAAALVQVGSSAPAPAQREQTITATSGDVIVTVLY